MFYPRNLQNLILDAAGDSPVVLINGARQTGKSTLLQQLYPPQQKPLYLTLDDVTVLSAATTSPEDFLATLPDRVLIDEIQRAPELFLALKQVVDRDRAPGRFLLTGSANVLALPKLSESLAGRMEIYTLWPLSQGEVRSHCETFIQTTLGASKPLPVTPVTITELMTLLVAGGYPESLKRSAGQRRRAWFQGYLTTLLQRDIRDLSQIEGLTALPNVLTLLASRAGGLLNVSDLARSLNVPTTTLRRYLTLLEMVFLTVPLPAWSSNIGKRLVKAPKMYLNDTGLLCHLLGLDESGLLNDRNKLGPVLENFVVLELLKQAGWSDPPPRLYHFRTQTGQEVDLVLELSRDRLIGIEIKAASTVQNNDFKGLRRLYDSVGDRLHRGIVLYSGEQSVAFDGRLWAVPISALWQW